MTEALLTPGKAVIQILVYIEREYGPETDSEHKKPGARVIQRGYFCDILFHVEWRVGKMRYVKLLRCVGETLPTLDEAREFVHKETGVWAELLPEPATPFVPRGDGDFSFEPVAFFVREFLPSDTSREAVEAASSRPNRSSDLARWLTGQKRLVEIRRPER